jgi:spore coat protein CotF
MEKFKRDLEVGQRAEEEVAALLESKGWYITYNTSKDLKTLRG